MTPESILPFLEIWLEMTPKENDSLRTLIWLTICELKRLRQIGESAERLADHVKKNFIPLLPRNDITQAITDDVDIILKDSHLR